MIKLLWVLGWNVYMLVMLWMVGAAVLNLFQSLSAAENNHSYGYAERGQAKRRAAWQFICGLGFALIWPGALLYKLGRQQFTNQVKKEL